MPSAPNRAIPLDGASNFRDLGGYRSRDGRSVRWRTLLRSDHLAALTPGDQATLRALKVAHALDFRGVEESAQAMYALPGVTRHALNVEPTVGQRAEELLARGETLDAARMEALMQETYRGFVRSWSAPFARFFALIATLETPLVFHCTAGKDRTGWAAALLLTALGVDEETVMQDYLLTNHHYRHPLPRSDGLLSRDTLQALWSVRPQYLAAALDQVRQDFGGLDNYLSTALGVDSAVRERLAERYLQ